MGTKMPLREHGCGGWESVYTGKCRARKWSLPAGKVKSLMFQGCFVSRPKREGSGPVIAFLSCNLHDVLSWRSGQQHGFEKSEKRLSHYCQQGLSFTLLLN